MKYFRKSYDYEGRFGSYWHQIHEISQRIVPGDALLEVGPGNNFLKNYLTVRNLTVETLDIVPDSQPTYLGKVTSIPCADERFALVCAFQILEHQPFELLVPSLLELGRVAKHTVLFSVPDVRWYLSWDVCLLSDRHRSRSLVSFPRLTSRSLPPPKSEDDHHWEIGRAGFPVSRVLAELNKLEGLTCQCHYRIPSNPFHHMFVLAKLNSTLPQT